MKAISWNKIFLVFGFWFDQTSAVLRGSCRECLSNSVACIDEVSFVTCKDGKMTNNLTKCPAGKVCTSERKICLSPADGFSPACYENICNTCAFSNGVFACIDETTYGFCYAGKEPDANSIRSCPNGRVCSVSSPEICVLKSEGGTPSCKTNGNEHQSSTTETSTVPTESTVISTETSETTETTKVTETTITSIPTVSTATQETTIDANAFCSQQKRTGNFKAANDPTCKQYIYCYMLSGEYLGQRYYCEEYFNSVTGSCQAARPSEC